MIFGVKIFDGKGRLKQDITKDEMEARHWSGFHFDITPYSAINAVATAKYKHAGAGSAGRVKPVRKINCGICKAEFLSSHIRAKYCSTKCIKFAKVIKTDKNYYSPRRVADRERYKEGEGWKITCQWRGCGKDVYKSTAGAKYCSSSHGYLERKARERE